MVSASSIGHREGLAKPNGVIKRRSANIKAKQARPFESLVVLAAAPPATRMVPGFRAGVCVEERREEVVLYGPGCSARLFQFFFEVNAQDRIAPSCHRLLGQACRGGSGLLRPLFFAAYEAPLMF